MCQRHGDAARLSVAGLKQAIGDTIDSLASPAGALTKDLVPSDPTGEMMTLLDQLSRNSTRREPSMGCGCRGTASAR